MSTLKADPEELLSAALDYARQGYRVHPLRAGTKIPRLKAWQDDATTDRKTIKAWWRKWPTSNVGIATGAKSDLWVLDVDLGTHPDEAREAIASMVADHGPFPETRTIRTPSGGLHYLHRFPEHAGAWTNSAKALTERYGIETGEPDPKTGKRKKSSGIDIRGEGGQIAAWPSVIVADNKGKPYKGGPRRYEVVRDVEPVPVPKWLRKLTRVREAVAQGLPAGSYDVKAFSDSDRARIASYLATTTTAIAAELDALKTDPAAQWDNEIFVRAMRLVDLANAPWSPLTLPEVRTLLLTHPDRGPNPSFSDARVIAKLDSAIRRASVVLPLPITPAPLLTTFEFPEELKGGDPGRFFHPKDGLLSERLADEVAELGELAVGLDGSSWVYGGGVWLRDPDEIERRVIRLLRNRYRPAHATIASNMLLKSGLLPVIAQQPTPRLINVVNGMLDWSTGELEPHGAGHLSTVQLPVAFEPEATSPAFDRWLTKVVPADVIPVLWEILGYLIMSGNPRQLAVLLHGDGGNGKGTLLRVLNALLGFANVSSVTLRDLSEGRFESAQLFGKIANIAGDIDAKYLSDTSKFKAITGGDVIEAQHKYGHPFRFTPWAVPIFSANEKWKSADTTSGYFRRWLTIPFPHKFTEKEVAGFDESSLLAELPGILNGAVRGLLRLELRGKFSKSHSVDELMRDFKVESDVAAIWLAHDERVLSEVGNTSLACLRPDVYRRYESWSRENGHSPLASDRLYQRLERLGYGVVRRAGGFTYLGLSIQPPSNTFAAVTGVYAVEGADE